MKRDGSKYESLIVFAIVLALNLSLALVLVFKFQLYQRDAMARSLHAWLILFGNEPKLANIGFLWPPLPVLLQLPLIIIRPLRQHGFAGNLVTAVAGALSATLLHGMLRLHGIKRAVRIGMLLVFVCNPMIALYSANGKSEMLAIAWFLLLAYQYQLWERNDEWIHLAWMGLAGALGFLTRYESLVTSAVFALWITVKLLTTKKGWWHTFAALLLYGVPVAYAIGVWLAANWMIMGNPIYFASGPYSTSIFAAMELQGKPWLVPIRSAAIAALLETAKRIWAIYPMAIIASAMPILCALWARQWTRMVTIALPLGFVLSAVANYLWGFPLLYMRYYIMIIPIAFVLVIWATKRTPCGSLLLIAAAVPLLLSGVSTWQAMDAQTSTIGEHYFVARLRGDSVAAPYAAEHAMAAYISAHAPERGVLADTAAGSDVMFFTGDPKLFILPSDSDYKQVLANPLGRVPYILVPEAAQSDYVNNVLKRYPALMRAESVGWASLVYRVEPWRLYQLNPDWVASTIPQQ